MCDPTHLAVRTIGKEDWVAIKTFNILLYSSFLAWTIANPGPKWKSTFATDSEADVKLYQSWEIATSARLQISVILCLVIGWTSFPLLVWQLFHQNKYVTSIVGAHLSKGKEKNTEEEKEEGVLPAIIPSQMEVAPLHCTVDITQKRRLFKNTKEIEKM